MAGIPVRRERDLKVFCIFKGNDRQEWGLSNEGIKNICRTKLYVAQLELLSLIGGHKTDFPLF